MMNRSPLNVDCILRKPLPALLLVLCLTLTITRPVAAERWQQRVDYLIDVTLLDSLRSLAGTATITYHNNSPDTLSALWFRLPPAALRKGSVVSRSWQRGRRDRYESVPEEQWGDLRVDSARGVDREVRFIQEGSIGRALLSPPLAPGDSTRFTLAFTTRFPTGAARSRIACIDGQYRGAYWYPSICPYTPRYGWTVNRYFGTAEAYGEFGTFEVRYTVPARFIVASTGLLVNQDEVLPPERLRGLALDNPNPDPIPSGEEGERPVRWVYRAENVPDVAFAADPRFLIDRQDYGNYEAWAFVRRGRQKAWGNAAELAGWTIRQLESIYGPYPWPRVVATDSWSGMEYPMLTMMSGSEPTYTHVMIHEVTHNYTPMILHSNSVDAGALDEGFTTFIEQELVKRWWGRGENRERVLRRGLFTRTVWLSDSVIRGRRPYLEAVLSGEDLPMLRGADIAEDYPLYRVSTYYKTPALLNALRSVIGEEAFWRGFRVYYRRHALTHVDERDVQASFEEAAGRPLGWFFEQFWRQSGDIDYGVRRFDVAPAGDGAWRVTLGLERRGEVRLPLRLAVVCESGDTLFGEIPFLPTDPALPGFRRWGSWDQPHRPGRRWEGSFTVRCACRPEGVLLDPEGRYWDRNPLDNTLPRGWPEVVFDDGLTPLRPPPVDRYRVSLAPAAGYDVRDGVQPGLRLRGSFLDREERFRLDLLTPTRGGQEGPRFRFGFAHPLGRGVRPVEGVLSLGRMHGDRWAEAGLQRAWRTWWPRLRNLRAALRVGTWERTGDPGGTAGPVTVPAGGSAAYVRAGFRLQDANARLPWTQEVQLVQGGGSEGFFAAQWTGITGRRLYRSLRLVLEGRATYMNPETPAQFRPTPAGNWPHELRGEPLFGGSWTGAGRSPASPLPGGPATLTVPNAGAADRFAAWRIALLRPLPAGFLRSGFLPANRLLEKVRIGLYHGGAVFHPEGAGGSTTGRLLEAGGELRLEELYGAGFSLRLAPWYRVEDGSGGGEGSAPARWTAADYLRRITFTVTLAPDLRTP